MGWRDRLRRASFRGVTFEVDTRTLSGGRRVVEHVYPQRDGAGTEDMGRAAHGMAVKAFVLGSDYDQRRDALVNALERGGKGEYIDPWGKHHTVVCRRWSLTETLAQGGMATFDLDFLEQTAESGHRVQTDTAHAVTTTANHSRTVGLSTFAAVYRVAGVGAFLADAKAVLQALAALTSALPVVAEVAQDAVDLAHSPSLLVQGVEALFTALAGLDTTTRWATGQRLAAFGDEIPAARARGGVYGSEEAATPWVPVATAAQREAAIKAAATGGSLSVADRLAVNRAALVDVVGDLALADLAQTASAQTYDSADAALAARDTLSTLIDSRMDSAGDATFRGLVALHGAVVADLTYRAAQLDRLVEFTPAATLPALVLAHRLYGDASQGAAICARNAIRHPGMVPGGSVLSILAKGTVS